MPSAQTEEKSLQMLIGEQLSAVTFVQDYLQLHFDGPRLTVFSHPVIRCGEQTFYGGKSGFRDALCNNIANKVTEVRVAYGESISIRFADGSTINIPLQDASCLEGESVNFDAGGAGAGGETVRGPMTILARGLPCASGRPVHPCRGASHRRREKGSPGEHISIRRDSV